MKKNLLTTSLLYIIGSFAIQGLKFITLPFFSRVMTPRDYALMSSYESWISILQVFIGFQAYACINNGYIDFGKKETDKFVSSITFLAIFTGFAVAFITTIFRRQIESLFEIKHIYLQLGIIQAFFAFCLSAITTKFRISDKPVSYLLFSIFNSVINIGLGIILVFQFPQKSYVGRIYSSAISFVVVGGISLVCIYYKGKCFYDKKYIKYAVTFSVPLIFHALSGIVMGKADQLMLLKMSGSIDMGVYSYGSNYAHIIYVLYTACNLAYIPLYYQKKAAQNDMEIARFNRLYISIFISFAGAIILILPEVIKIMSGTEYFDAIKTAPILGLAFIANFLYTFPVNYEFYKKKTQYIAYSTIFAAIINVILNVIFIRLWTGVGAALTTCFSTLIQLIVHYHVAHKLIGGYEMHANDFVVPLIKLGGIAFVYYAGLEIVFLRWGIAAFFVCFGVMVFLKERTHGILQNNERGGKR